MTAERLAEIRALVAAHEAGGCECDEQFYPGNCGGSEPAAELLAEVDRLTVEIHRRDAGMRLCDGGCGKEIHKDADLCNRCFGGEE